MNSPHKSSDCFHCFHHENPACVLTEYHLTYFKTIQGEKTVIL